MGDIIFQQTYSKPYDMGQPILNGGYYYSPSGRLCPPLIFLLLHFSFQFQAPPTHITMAWPCSQRTPGSTPPSAWRSSNFLPRGPQPPSPPPSPSPCFMVREKECPEFLLFEERIFLQDHLVPPPLQCFFLLQALQLQHRLLQLQV